MMGYCFEDAFFFPLPFGERVGDVQHRPGEGARNDPYPPHPTSTNGSASLHRAFISLSPTGRGKTSWMEHSN